MGVLGQTPAVPGQLPVMLGQMPAVLELVREDVVVTAKDADVVRVDRIVSAKML